MAGEDEGAEKTEDASPRRRERAREEGQVAISSEVGVAVTMVVLAITLSWLVPGIGARVLDDFRQGLGGLEDPRLDLPRAVDLVRGAGLAAAGLAGPVALLALALGVGLGVAQTGLLFSTEALGFKWERLDPTNWLSRIFSVEVVMIVLKAVVKGVGVLAVAYLALEDEPARLWRLAFVPPSEVGGRLVELAHLVVVRMALALGLLAAVDYAWTRWRYEERLKMSRQELKEEAKESEGNPQQKAARRRRMRELTERKGLAERVREATVVAVNPTHYAVALRYRPKRDAVPVVVAKGVDFRALKIRALAEQNAIPVIEDVPLARALHAVTKEGKPIPSEVYGAVAKLLALVYRRGGWRSR
jgi:flagellar biosynthetic protein FlhB